MERTATSHWRWAAWAVALSLTASLVAAHVVLRRDIADSRALDATLADDLAAVTDELDVAEQLRARLVAEQHVADAQLEAVIGRLERATRIEADELAALDARRTERGAAEAELAALTADVTEAQRQSDANHRLISALDRCLDGATQAANALAVGDRRRSLHALAAARASCDAVGVVVG